MSKLPAIMINSDFYNKPRNRVWISEQGAEAVIVLQALWLASSQEKNGKFRKSEIVGLSLPFPLEKNRLESVLNSAVEVGLLEQDEQHFFNSQILKDKKSFEEKRKNYSNARKKVKEIKELPNEDSKRILKESSLNPTEYEPVYVTDTEVLNNKEIVSPIWPECEHLRMSESEAQTVLSHYKKNNYPVELLPKAAQVLDDWLGSTGKEALKARKQKTHYRRMWADWVLESAQKLHKVANPQANGKLTNAEKAQILVQKAKAREAYDINRNSGINALHGANLASNGGQRIQGSDIRGGLQRENKTGNAGSSALDSPQHNLRLPAVDSKDSRSPENSKQQVAAAEIIQSLARKFDTNRPGKTEADRKLENEISRTLEVRK